MTVDPDNPYFSEWSPEGDEITRFEEEFIKALERTQQIAADSIREINAEIKRVREMNRRLRNKIDKGKEEGDEPQD